MFVCGERRGDADAGGRCDGCGGLGGIGRNGDDFVYVAVVDEVRTEKCWHLTIMTLTLTETDISGGHHVLKKARAQACQDPGGLLWSGIRWKDIRFREESIFGNSN